VVTTSIGWFCEFYEGPVVLVLINKIGFGSSSINQTQFQSCFGLIMVNLDQNWWLTAFS